MNKKTIYLVSLLLLCFAYACRKEFYVKDQQQEVVAGVKQWLNVQTKNQALSTALFRKPRKNGQASTASTASKADIRLTADWAKAKIYETTEKTIIEVPLLYNGVFLFNFKPLAKGDSISRMKSITRLLFFKTGEKTEGYFMTMIADDDYLNNADARPQNNTYLEKETGFSGAVIYHDLLGNYSSSKRFDKAAKTTKLTGKKGSPALVKDAAAPECYDQDIWEVFGVGCEEIYPGYIQCDYVYSEYIGTYTICNNNDSGNEHGEGGGGGGGGDPEPEPIDTALANIIGSNCLNTTQMGVLNTVVNDYVAGQGDAIFACIQKALYLKVRTANKKINFCVDTGLTVSSNGTYNPATGSMLWKYEVTMSSVPVFAHEFFHVVQDVTYTGGTDQFRNGTGTGFPNIEFEAALMDDIMNGTDVAHAMGSGAPQSIKEEYKTWLETITADNTKYPKVFADFKEQYAHFLGLFYQYSPYAGQGLIDPNLQPTALLNTFSSTNCK